MKLNYGLRSSDKDIRKGFHSHFFRLNKKVLPIALVIMMAIQMVVPFYALAQVNNNEPNKQVFVEGESYVVNSWEELKQIIEEGTYNGSNPVSKPNNINIVINGPIGAKSTINISRGKTINLSGQNGAIIYGAADGNVDRAKIDNYRYGSMFLVDGGTLNTDDKVIFSGKRAIYKDDTCNDNVPLNDQSVVGYTPKDKYDFSNYGEISYTKSVAAEEYDYQYSDISYVPYVYPNAYDFTNFTTTYTPGSQGNRYSQFSYPDISDFTNFGIVSAWQQHQGGDTQDTTAICEDIEHVQWKMYFSRSPQKPYATSQSVSGVGDWIRVGEGVDDNHQKYYYFYATEFNKRIYIAADGTLARDRGSLFDNGNDGKLEYRWYPTSTGLIATKKVVVDGVERDEVHYMHRDASTGLLTFPTTQSANDATGLFVNDDKQVMTLETENNPFFIGSWGRKYRAYPVVFVNEVYTKGTESSPLVNGQTYYLQATNNQGLYSNLAVNSNGEVINLFGRNTDAPINPHNTPAANTIWEFIDEDNDGGTTNDGVGIFRAVYPSDANVNNKTVFYWDGTQIKSTTYGNWLQLKGPHNSSLKIKNTEVFKPADSTTGLALSGSPIMVLDAETLEEKNSLSNNDVVVLQSDGLYFFNKDGKWVDEPDDETNFKWTYNDGVLSNGNYKIFIEADGTNPRVVDDSDRGSNPISDSKLKANNNNNNNEFELYKGSTTGTVLNTTDTTGTGYITLYESNNSSAPTTEASATLTNGAKYLIKSGDGDNEAYLRGKGTDYEPEWVLKSKITNWPRFDWTYNSSDGTLSHGVYKILVNSDGTVEIVDSTKKKTDAVNPILKINNTQVYKGSILSTTSGDPVYLYKIAGSSGSYQPGEEASSINDGPFYVKAGNQWLRKNDNEDAKWDEDPGTARQYNDSRNPYVWVFDPTNKTLTHGDYAIYLDGTNGVVVDKRIKVGDITFGGSIRYATTNATNLFAPNGTNSVYMYEVNTNGSKGNHADSGLVLDKYYYLVTEEDNKYLQANDNGGSWTDFTNQTNQKDNPFAWKYISKTKDGVAYNILYNEETDQIIYHNGTKLTMAPNTVIHCASELANRWTPVNKQDSTCPGETNFHHAVEDLPGVNTEKLGYFITAKNKSNINVSGTTFKDLYVGKGGAVKDYAPIVINDSTFNMSSGSIQNNVVGYTADERISGMQVTGSNPEHTSGVKNYLNSKKMTNTAGGIIFTNGAKAQITGESYIKQNKGDVGGILVQGDGTDVTLGARIPDIENDIILDVIGGGHIDQNTGFHHAGAALVENGGLLRMAAPDSTMNNNVTWAKGGAVWATDFGTNGYAIVDYKQKKLVNPEKRQTKQVTENGVTKTVSNAGTFIMKNGTIDNNTAFVRGGGINVESDHVHLLGGTISNNNCRALGGGIYVVGDFPDYTYTLLLDRGYVGHNYSVRYWDLDDFNSTDNDVNGAWDHLSLRELNNRLDRKLGAEDDGTGNPINSNSVFANQPDGYINRTADVRDYPRPHEGTGGGIWLCPIGGTAIFNLHDDHEVVVDDNYASGNASSDNRKGTDIYLHSGTGHILISKDDGHIEDWRNEANNNKVAASKEGEGDVYSGPLYLINATDDATYDERKNKYNSSESEYQAYLADTSKYIGVRIIDNISRDGGGIAADGTLLFGLPTDVYRHEAQLGFKKIWPTNADTYPVTFKLFHYDYITVTENTSSSNPSTLVVKSTELDADGDGLIDSTYTKDGKTYNVPSFYLGKDTLNELSGYEFHLDGIAGNEDDYQKSPETTVPSGTNDTVGGLQANGEHHWTADTTIPVTVEVIDQSGNIVTLPLYTLRYTGETTSVQIPVGGESTTYETVTVQKDEILDPSSDIGMKKIYAIAATNPNKFEVADWNIVIKEYNAAGMEIKEAEFSSITSGEIHITEGYVDVIDAGGIGKKVRGYSINFSEANFSSTAKNGEGPSVEKYINNKVHQDLGIFSESFEYTIMAYVPLDATEVVIEDTLEDALMFVDTNGKEQFINFGSNKSYKVVTNSDVDFSWVGDFWVWVENDEPGLEAGYYKIIKSERVLKKNSSNVVYNINSIETTKWSEPGYVKPNNLREYGTFVNGESTSSASNYVDNSSSTGYDLVIVNENNHKGNGLPLSDNKSGTVTQHTNIEYFRNHPEQHLNGPINNTVEIGYYDANNNFIVSPDGNTIRVTVTDEMLKGEATGSSANQVDAHGKWIMLSFDAAIKPEYRDIELLRQKTNGWITEEESKIGSTNLFSELESIANVTINRVLHNEQTGLYYARAKDSGGNDHYYIYVSKSPEKQFVIENNTNVETDEYLALHWYEVFYGNTRYYPIDGENKGKNIVLWDATYNGTNAFVNRVGANNTVNGLNNSSNTPSIGAAATKEIDFYNYPVIEGQVPHSGVKNQASYTITYPHGGKSNYKTNIVTVDINQPEKYVNDKVHEILRHDQTAEGAFDQVFEYEIMVYVPDNADEIIIYDTLRDDLMFVDRHGKTQYKTYTIGTSENDDFSELTDIPNVEFMVRNDDDNAISNDTNNLGVTLVANDGKSIDPENDGNSHQLQYFKTNDHKGDGTGTVSTNGTDINGPITAGNIVIAEAPTGDVTSLPTNNKEGNTIYIKLDESTGINNVKGKWVKVSFFAQIKPTRYVDIVNKLQKSSRHTNVKTLAVDYDASTNLDPTPVGYNYRTTDKTSLKMNAKGYNPNTDTVPDTSKVGYYEKNTETGYFTEFTTTLPSGTEGVDYIQAYESGFVYHASTLNDIPEEVKTKGTSEYEAVYLKKGWNDTDDNISWEKVTDDGNVIDGINLHRNNTTKEAYLDVQADGSHAGLANNAKYAVRFDNEWKYSTTNTVTVVPLLRTITIKKMWILSNEEAIPSAHELLEHLHLYWERITNLDNTQASDHGETVGKITDLYKDHISIVQEKVETITGNTRYTWRIEITDLPQLRPSMKYFIKEIRFDGFNSPRYINPSDPEATEHAHDTGSILNSKDTEDVELLVTKKWDGASESEYQNETIKVQLLENGHYVYKRDNQFRVLDEDGNLVSDTGKQPAENLDFTKEINSSEDWFILFDSLPKYQRDNDGNYITEVAYDIYGHEIRDKDDNLIYNNKLNDYSIKVLSDSDGYILSVVNDYEKVYTYTPTIYPQEAYDFIEPDEYQNGDKVFNYGTLNGNIGYFIYDVYSETIMEDGFPHTIVTIDENSGVFYANGDTNRPLEDQNGISIDSCALLPSTAPYSEKCYRQAYYKIDVHKNYKVDLVNTKPQIEKYINKDVHQKGYFSSDITYDILVYVPEEATEIEITDQLLPTLSLISIDEPQLSGNESKEIISYRPISVTTLSEDPNSAVEINLAVHERNNHEIYGTVNSETVSDTVLGKINKDENGFIIKINNIVPASGDYVEYEHGEYVKVRNEAGNTTYIKANEVEYYSVVDGVDATNPISYEGRYVRLRTINNNTYQYVKYSAYLNYPQMLKDSYEIDPANAFYELKEYERIDDSYYRKKNESYYIVDASGDYVKAKDNKIGNKIVFAEPNSIPDGYERLGSEFYSLADSFDQKIGGKYVQVTFTAKLNTNGYAEDASGDYVLGSDNNYYLANELPYGVTRVGTKKYSPKEVALQRWIESNESSSTPREDLDWDIITDYGAGVDGNNKGWDAYVKEALVANGHPADAEYITSDFGILIDYLNDNNKTIDVVLKDNDYYLVRDNDGVIYQYRRTDTTAGYAPLIRQWFRVTAPISGSAANNAAIFYIVGDKAGQQAVKSDNSPYWLGLSWNEIQSRFQTYDNGSTASALNIVPITPDSYYKIPDENGNDKYYLVDVAEQYAKDILDAAENDSIRKTIYRKVDWGRGDGNVLRNYPNNFSGEQYNNDHAGIVNTSSYEITYGNGYKSNHKSNTVTYVPDIYRLPSSGGSGTYWINLIGSMLAALALMNYVSSKPKKKRRVM